MLHHGVRISHGVCHSCFVSVLLLWTRMGKYENTRLVSGSALKLTALLRGCAVLCWNKYLVFEKRRNKPLCYIKFVVFNRFVRYLWIKLLTSLNRESTTMISAIIKFVVHINNEEILHRSTIIFCSLCRMLHFHRIIWYFFTITIWLIKLLGKCLKHMKYYTKIFIV